MKRTILFAASAVWSLAQVIPNHYIVEFSTQPGAAVAIANHQGLSAAAREVSVRRTEVAVEQATAEASIAQMGGTVHRRYNTLLNAMAVEIDPAGAAALRQMPGVIAVHPDTLRKKNMDQAILLHKISAAWATLPNGQASAGAGMKIGILDTGIDITHPAFQTFSTPVPSGFPITDTTADVANTNSKVIVARAYIAPDASDVDGHGTGVAMIAAGNPVDPQTPGVNPFSGVAPAAWLGNYNVFGTDGTSTDSAFLQALEDAVNDGMNVVNYSAGGPSFDLEDETGADERAIHAALSLGVVVVVAAGNRGADPTSVESPAVAPSAIAVGGNENQRLFWNGVTIAGMQPILGIVPDAEFLFNIPNVTAPVVDIATVDSNGYGCSALPANSLSGQIALISRGSPNGTTCTFDSKLNNAQNAGAAGAIIFDNKTEPLFDYTVSAYDIAFGFNFADSNGNPFQLPSLFVPSILTATLPALFVSNSDGLAIKKNLATNPGPQGTLDMFGFTPLPRPANMIVDSSSRGPTGSGRIKPDMTAAGDWMVTADLVANASGSAPYVFIDGTYATGTSDAAPLVTGSVAVLMAQRPGLSGAQYRSLVINSADEFDNVDGSIAAPQSVGAGRLDLLSAVTTSAAVTPTSISFVAAASSSSSSTSSASTTAAKTARDVPAGPSAISQTFSLTNISANSDTYTISLQPIDTVAQPSVDTPTLTLAPQASQTVTLSLPANLAPGTYHGFVLVTASSNGVVSRVPYWLGVVDSSNLTINILNGNTGVFEPLGPDSAGTTDTIFFRVTDVNGVAISPAVLPTVVTNDSGASVQSVVAAGTTPGTYAANITIGQADQNNENTFTITVGTLSLDVKVLVF
jgi:minor extracellular serine protease Vpr